MNDKPSRKAEKIKMSSVYFNTSQANKEMDMYHHAVVMILDRYINVIQPENHWENCAEDDREAYLTLHLLSYAMRYATDLIDVWNAYGHVEFREAFKSITAKKYTTEIERKFLIAFLEDADDYLESTLIENSPDFVAHCMASGPVN